MINKIKDKIVSYNSKYSKSFYNTAEVKNGQTNFIKLLALRNESILNQIDGNPSGVHGDFDLYSLGRLR